MRYHILFFILLLAIPMNNVFANVRITEVAWMGVSGDNGQYGEWIELYNDDSLEKSLAGWRLYGSGDQLIFTLSKIIPAKGYLLVERTTASMSDPVPGVDDERGAFGGGGLSNEGEDLSLRDSSGATIHSLPYASGWPAGDVSTKKTMQWDGGKWVTAVATPKGESLSGNTDTQEDDSVSDTTDTVSESSSSSSSERTERKRYKPTIVVNAPSELFQYIDHEFSADVVLEQGPLVGSARIVWNMGDGTIVKQERVAPLLHKYDFMGTYTVWVGYYENIFATKPYLSVTKIIKVTNPSVVLIQLNDRTIEITNQSGKAIDLSDWRVISKGQYGALPPFTFLAPDASITISASSLGFDSLPQAVLTRPKGEIMLASTLRSSNGNSAVKGETYSSQIADGEDPLPNTEKDVFSEEIIDQPKRNHTKKIVFGVIALTVLALCILLERFMAKREHLE